MRTLLLILLGAAAAVPVALVGQHVYQDHQLVHATLGVMQSLQIGPDRIVRLAGGAPPPAPPAAADSEAAE